MSTTPTVSTSGVPTVVDNRRLSARQVYQTLSVKCRHVLTVSTPTVSTSDNSDCRHVRCTNSVDNTDCHVKLYQRRQQVYNSVEPPTISVVPQNRHCRRLSERRQLSSSQCTNTNSVDNSVCQHAVVRQCRQHRLSARQMYQHCRQQRLSTQSGVPTVSTTPTISTSRVHSGTIVRVDNTTVSTVYQLVDNTDCQHCQMHVRTVPGVTVSTTPTISTSRVPTESTTVDVRCTNTARQVYQQSTPPHQHVRCTTTVSQVYTRVDNYLQVRYTNTLNN